VDAADSFVTALDVDAAMSSGWTERVRGDGTTPSEIAVELGAVHDPTVIRVAHRAANGRVYIDKLVTLQGSREHPVQMSVVESTIRALASAFAPVKKIRIESWQGMGTAQTLTRLGLPVELYTPTFRAQPSPESRG
jgi:hypothetical protein